MIRLKHVTMAAAFGAALLAPHLASATPLPGQTACWQSNVGEDPRPEISCQTLSPEFLRKLEHATPAQVVKLFAVPGKDGKPTYFEGVGKIPGFYNGYVELVYTKGHVTNVSAVTTEFQKNGMAGDEMDFRWDSVKGECSDFPGSTHRCNAAE
ncbi:MULTISPECIES: hypothetical protein [Gluconobacter]|uniref:Uncharacterized protein n=1 Tax=Gluconobacter cadivus TaxID=2728101 RepID=A0ABR9YS41_9PROT|nr:MULTISPECIES: hypothetical protein [Gluconobacter]MBF0887336.1 hypothetical protein [Gluconobacter cadivus]MBS1059405.1 hypothetical protein [Gluconobacter sp. Dm-44]